MSTSCVCESSLRMRSSTKFIHVSNSCSTRSSAEIMQAISQKRMIKNMPFRNLSTECRSDDSKQPLFKRVVVSLIHASSSRRIQSSAEIMQVISKKCMIKNMSFRNFSTVCRSDNSKQSLFKRVVVLVAMQSQAHPCFSTSRLNADQITAKKPLFKRVVVSVTMQGQAHPCFEFSQYAIIRRNYASIASFVTQLSVYPWLDSSQYSIICRNHASIAPFVTQFSVHP